MLENVKIYVGKFSKEIQEKAFSLGWSWKFCGTDKLTPRNLIYPFLYFHHNKCISYGDDVAEFNEHSYKEVTLDWLLNLPEPKINDLDENVYEPGDIRDFDKLVKLDLHKRIDEIRGYYISNIGKISKPNYKYNSREMEWFKFFKNMDEAIAYKYLPELLYWRDVYNDDWKPTQNERKYVILFDFDDNEIKKTEYDICSALLVFERAGIRDEFYKKFYNLIKVCSPLLIS